MSYVTDLDTATQLVVDRLNTNKTPLGLKAVYYGSNHNINGFPCAIAEPVVSRRRRSTTGLTLDVDFTVLIYLAHAKLTQTHSQRSKENLAMVDDVFEIFNTSVTFGGQLIDSFIESDEPVIGRLTGPANQFVVGTRMTWVGKSRR